jgi:hypothetical protein
VRNCLRVRDLPVILDMTDFRIHRSLGRHKQRATDGMSVVQPERCNATTSDAGYCALANCHRSARQIDLCVCIDVNGTEKNAREVGIGFRKTFAGGSLDDVEGLSR